MRALAAVAVLAASVLVLTPSDRGSAAAETGLSYLGTLPLPAGTDTIRLATFDPASRRMWGTYTIPSPTPRPGEGGFPLRRFLATYDTSTPVPTYLSSVLVSPDSVSPTGPYSLGHDRARRQLYMISEGVYRFDAGIAVVPIDGGSIAKKWNLKERLPGFYAGGLTYSAEDDRIYVVGEFVEQSNFMAYPLTFGVKPTGSLPAVAAFSPEDGALLWFRTVPDCVGVLFDNGTGAFLARSTPNGIPTVFFACASGATPGNANLPGQSGLVEMHIDPAATATDAAAFDVRFHPISGQYFDGAKHGLATYDHGSDRFFMQSLSQTTPAAWVFDARVGGWVGAITAPHPRNHFLGVNETTGHFYTGGGREDPKGFLLIADGRTTPPQNGVAFDQTFAPGDYVFTDGPEQRIYVKEVATKIHVYKDVLPTTPPQEPLDYDALTDDVTEKPGTYVAFTGDSGGFGARATAVGDTAGTPTSGRTPAASRAIVLARVPTVNVQPSGAAAAAQALGMDTTSIRQLETTPVPFKEETTVTPSTTPLTSTPSVTIPPVDVMKSVSPDWPYGPKTCLDGGNGVQSTGGDTQGEASVSCVLEDYEAEGRARHAGADLDVVRIGNSSYDSKVKRTVRDGLVNTATATSTGVSVGVPGVGTLRIGKVEVVATTGAHGRSGTATASWVRTIRDVVVEDVNGEVLYESAGCSSALRHDGSKLTPSGDAGTCDAMAEAIRKLLQVRVRLLFPEPAVLATKKGAFARVGQSEAQAANEVTVNEQGKVFDGDTTTRRALPGLQINVYNDSAEKSRYIVQLAAAESTSVFTVNRSADDFPCDVGGCIPGGVEGLQSTVLDDTGDGGGDFAALSSSESPALPPDGSALVTKGSGRTGNGRTRNIVGARLTGLVIGRRSLGDGALMASFAGLVGGAAALVGRRRRFAGLVG